MTLSDGAIAIFAATRPELHRAFPRWRIPIDPPAPRQGLNPFTRKPQRFESTRDPSPGADLEGATGEPSHYVRWPSLDDLVLLDLELANEALPESDDYESFLRELTEQRGFFHEALFGSPGGPWILELPRRFSDALKRKTAGAAYRTAGRDVLLERYASLARASGWDRRVDAAKAAFEPLVAACIRAGVEARELFVFATHPYS